LTGLVAALDGSEVLRIDRSASREAALILGIEVARALLDAGASRILSEIYNA
jgi:hydroxymethylbilane synthase